MTLSAGFVRECVNTPLGAFGFSRVSRRNVWVRGGLDIDHGVSLEHAWGSWSVRWDVLHPAAGYILHGKRCDLADVQYAGIISGHAQPSLGADVVARFSKDDTTSPAVTFGVKLAVHQVAGWLAEFVSADDVIAYLTRAPEVRDPRVTVPSGASLPILTAAALAAATHRADAGELAARAQNAIGPAGHQTTVDRLDRLAASLS